MANNGLRATQLCCMDMALPFMSSGASLMSLTVTSTLDVSKAFFSNDVLNVSALPPTCFHTALPQAPSGPAAAARGGSERSAASFRSDPRPSLLCLWANSGWLFS